MMVSAGFSCIRLIPGTDVLQQLVLIQVLVLKHLVLKFHVLESHVRQARRTATPGAILVTHHWQMF